MIRSRLLAPLLLACVATPPAGAQSALEVRGVPEGVPFEVEASATERLLLIDLSLDPEWHAYARDVGGGRPVAVRLAEGGAFRAAGELVTPGDGRGQLAGRVRLELALEPVADLDPAAGARPLRGTLDLQVCDALECLRPMSLELVGEVETPSVLLVSVAAGERAGRIAAGIAARGFRVDRATYASVSAEQCDGHDLVVADSELFGRIPDRGAAIARVREFPRTATPVVAVGFLGTELVEGQGLAMTSGYI